MYGVDVRLVASVKGVDTNIGGNVVEIDESKFGKVKYHYGRWVVAGAHPRMQMFPSTPINPRTAVHFALLDWLHKLKMEARVSNHAMSKVANYFYQITNSRATPLSKTILNDIYSLYRRVVQHAEGVAEGAININSCPCLICWNNPTKGVTLDGNFQVEYIAKQSFRAYFDEIAANSNTAKYLYYVGKRVWEMLTITNANLSVLAAPYFQTHNMKSFTADDWGLFIRHLVLAQNRREEAEQLQQE